jgi:hypothetical protein
MKRSLACFIKSSYGRIWSCAKRGAVCAVYVEPVSMQIAKFNLIKVLLRYAA